MQKTISGDTPLLLAALNYVNTDILVLLLNHGANIEAKNRNGFTALIWAAYENHTEAETILLAKGAKIDAADASGQTALMNAVSQERTDSSKPI